MESLAQKEARNFLSALCTGCKALADAHPQQYTYEKTLRPDTPTSSGRSGYILRKLYSQGEEQFTMVSSGASAPKAFAIIDLLSQHIGIQANIRAVDEYGKSLDMTNETDRKAIAHLHAGFPSGQSLSWTAVSGITIHCPTKAAFNKLTSEYIKAEQAPDIRR